MVLIAVVLAIVAAVAVALIRAISLAFSKVVTDASFVVTPRGDRVCRFVVGRPAALVSCPVCYPVAGDISRSCPWEIPNLVTACQTILRWHAEKFEPLAVIIRAPSRCESLRILIALVIAIDDIDGRTKAGG